MKTYPKILQMHQLHMATEKEYNDIEWIVQEKIDGSQFRISFTKEGVDIGSKGMLMVNKGMPVAVDKMFKQGVDYILGLRYILPLGVREITFYCEYLEKPRHNALAYDRIPKNNLVLFDVYIEDENNNCYFVGNRESLEKYAELLEIDVVPQLNINPSDIDKMNEEIKGIVSYLGGANIEGVVLKSYKTLREREPYFGEPISLKNVRQEFKEINREINKKDTPLNCIVSKYKTNARWEKAINHLKEQGKLTYELKDLSFLINEAYEDLIKEEGSQIKEDLFALTEREFKTNFIRGLPDYYKDWLIKNKNEVIK